MLYAIWAISGWCGNEIRRWRLPPAPPPPDPWVPWLVGTVVGVLGGIAGGGLFNAIGASDPMPGIVGALMGGVVLSGFVARLGRM